MKKILVIEDDEDIAELVNLALSDLYNVQLKTDGYNIEAEFLNGIPDLIMLDNYVGDKQSSQILQEIRNIDAAKSVPVVLFSGHSDIEKIAEEIKATTYLAKPFGLKDLYNCVDNVLNDAD